ncbi:MAG TPA: rRNA maturation RNase YbeY [Vicinamibacterales bacterium]|nr:rRNA maturation RNase YbeY [Vicinamibacterales bacterium]
MGTEGWSSSRQMHSRTAVRPGTTAPDVPARRLRIVVGDERGRRLRMAGLSSWLRRVAPARARGRVSIALVSDRRVRTLNRTYRRQDCVTDVLSFPVGATQSPASRPRPRRGSSVLPEPPTRAATMQDLGEIVIARGLAGRQARKARHSELTELRVLALHGLLHLLGYDHERDRGRMRRLEERLRRKGGLREGLIERSESR